MEEPASTPECEQYLRENRDSGRPEDVTMACEYANDRTIIAVRTELRESAPDAVEFLEKWSISGAEINALLVRLDETRDDVWKDWVTSDIADKVLAAL